MNATLPDSDFLFELLDTPSPTGFEAAGQKIWANYLRPTVDSVENDAYGTVWATLEGSEPEAPTLMLEAHADEIGFIVKYITSEGFLHLDRVGGIDQATARGRQLKILGEKGIVAGIIGNTAIHIRDRKGGEEKAPNIHELFVDIGASSDEEVAAMGIRVGHPAVYSEGARLWPSGKLVGRALDNRLGSYIVSQVMKRLAAEKPASTVYAVNAVQEEIGGYGAKMVTHRLRPHVAIVLDVTHATDTPGIDKTKHGAVTLGSGPTITHGTCNHPLIVERITAVAQENDIALQHESSSRYSGTDTDQIYHVREGIPSGLISLPLRYMHSVVEMVDLEDIERTIGLLTHFAQSLQKGENFHLQI